MKLLAAFIVALVAEFILGGLFVMWLTGIIFPVFGQPGLSFWNSGACGFLFTSLVAAGAYPVTSNK